MDMLEDFLKKSNVLIKWWKLTLSFAFISLMILMALIGGSIYWEIEKLKDMQSLIKGLNDEVRLVVMGIACLLLLLLFGDIIQSIRVSFSASKLLKITVEKRMKRFLMSSRIFLLLMLLAWIIPFFTDLSSFTISMAVLSFLLKFLFYRNDSSIRKLKASAAVASFEPI